MKMNEEILLLVDLFKFYLELLVHSGIFAGAVLGGILGYLVKQGELIIKYYYIPAFLSAIFALIYLVSLLPSIQLASAIYDLGKIHNLKLIPHAWLLPTTVSLFFLVFTLMCIFICTLPRRLKRKSEFKKGSISG